ncbi:pyocin S6 family toxin immunity protein [Pseudomonas fluorescens]|uniref:pyocin S6 family toxin immunity protein n=1 Tax=Pseudomonas fluorescens TaxID=294 RepID=UPI0004BE43A7|nr:pyocin S6 family toxin immunity protein [Pseudomonas fluorescens]
MSYFSITGFYPDDRNDDSLQFEMDIKNAEQNEMLAQITEGKTFVEVRPGELEITNEQLREIGRVLGMEFPAGLEYYIGTCVDA